MKPILLLRRISHTHRIKIIFRCVFIWCFISLTACATAPRDRFFDDFIIVKPEAEDDFSSLAAKYLGGSEKAWQIAEFNNITSPKPGQELVIPLAPFKWGGLEGDGYQAVPILAYFRFSRSKTSKLAVSESAFKEQMKYLKEKGYYVITLDQFLDFLDFKIQIPKKSVMITFDDGWRSVYDIAFPVLRGYGFPATLFVYTDFIGNRKALSWKQVDELAKNGFDIQSKARTHRDMTKLNKGESFKEYFRAVQKDISQPKKIIRKKLRRECECMAYPHGKTNNLIISIMKKEGYRAGFTLTHGPNPFYINNYRVNRSVIHGRINMDQFKNNLSLFSKSELK